MKLFNPLKVYRNLQNVYSGYLETFWETRYKNLNDKIFKASDPSKYIKGPYLQLSFDYQLGKKIEELVDEGVLHPLLKDIYPGLHLRKHQEEAIRNIVTGKNTLISTGTASGKTKAFLIPVFDYILKLKDQLKNEGKDTKGVKALLLYPMNALVNDQLEELRQALSGTGITFGRYTGDTPYTEEDIDKKEYKNLKKKCPEELITREEILKEIPDILITNYSMLEFLLLRPKDISLFEADLWKFIVLDEVHVYDGAKGTEVGLLLRRLKERAFKEKPICIGASATMGKGTEEDIEKAAEFASKLFGEKFEKKSVILPSYKEDFLDNSRPLWHKPLDFIDIQEKYSELSDKDFKNYLLGLQDISNLSRARNKEEMLFYFFENYQGYRLIRDYLKAEKVVPLQDFISAVSTKYEPPLDEEQLLAFTDLLYKAKKERKSTSIRLLDAKFHIFIRSPEGIFATIEDSGDFGEIFFKKIIEYEERKVFQLTTCRNCGEVFITGYKKRKHDGKVYIDVDPEFLEDPFKLESEGRTFIYLTRDKIEKENEADFKLGVDGVEIEFEPKTGEVKPRSGHLKKPFHTYELLPEDSPYQQPRKCPSCGIVGRHYKKGRWVSFFTPPDEYPQAVSLESVYKDLVDSAEDPKERKIIVFSDSRKDASFFAPFFQRFYNDRWFNQILYNRIPENRDISLELLSEYCVNCLYSGFHKKPTESERQRERRRFSEEILKDFMYFNEDSLEGTGLVRYRLDKSIEDDILGKLKDTHLARHLTDEELENLIYHVYGYFRRYKITNDFFGLFSGRTRSVWEEGTPPRKPSDHLGIDVWIPKKTGYIFRLFKKILPGLSDNDIKDILRQIFPIFVKYMLGRFIVFNSQKGYMLDEENIFDKWFISKINETFRCNTCRKITPWNVKNVCPHDKCGGTLEKIRTDDIHKAVYLKKLFGNLNCGEAVKKKVRAEEHTAQLTTEQGRAVQEDFKKGKINVLSCSTTFELGVDLGDLQVVYMHNVPPRPDNYVQRAGRAGRSSKSAALVVSYALNRPHDLKVFEDPLRMIKGEINPPIIKENNKRIILRHLNAVLFSHYLRNNFAGESRITVSDFMGHFENFKSYADSNPENIKEEIKRILGNRDLITEFGVDTWQWWSGTIPSIEDHNSKTLFERIEKELSEDINEINNVLDELEDEIQDLGKRLRRGGLSQEERSRKGYLEGIRRLYEENLNEIYNQDIITFFSRKVFIPKYGFPVDTVSLDVKGARVRLPGGIERSFSSIVELDRGLDLAIGEYAPGERLIAAGHMLMSTNVKILKGMGPIEESSELYHYFYCKKCLYFQDSRELLGYSECPVCGESRLSNLISDRYIIPRGFETRNMVELFNAGNIKNLERILNHKTFSEAGGLSKSQRIFVPVGQMDRDFKPINLSRKQSFFSSEGDRFKGPEEKEGFTLTAYNRGIIATLNVSESRKVDIERGVSKGMYSESYIRARDLEEKFVNLGYRFYTDVLVIEPPLKVKHELIDRDNEDPFSTYLSLLFAILEGASSVLDIKREDISGMIKFNNLRGDFKLILYDNVPAGAGFIEEIYDKFTDVLEEAKKIVNNCSCSPDSVCSVCLLHPTNQYYAGKLKRVLASKALDVVQS